MDIDYILEVIGKNDLSIAIQQSSWAFQALETIHVFAFALVVGTILAVDLRLLGLCSRKSRVTEMIEDCLQWTWLGFILAFITGFMMFMTKSAIYFEAATFRWKMALLLLAGLNMLVFHFRTFQSVAQWNDSQSIPLAARLAGGLSIILWAAIIVLGRWIGFAIVDI